VNSKSLLNSEKKTTNYERGIFEEKYPHEFIEILK
jgi:hypothetical protein